MLGTVDEESLVNAALEEQLEMQCGGIHDLWEKRRAFGWHDAFIAGALIDPSHYNKLAGIMQPERVKGEKVIASLAGLNEHGRYAQRCAK